MNPYYGSELTLNPCDGIDLNLSPCDGNDFNLNPCDGSRLFSTSASTRTAPRTWSTRTASGSCPSTSDTSQVTWWPGPVFLSHRPLARPPDRNRRNFPDPFIMADALSVASVSDGPSASDTLPADLLVHLARIL